MRYGMIKLLVLKLLQDGSRTGYELMKEIETLTGRRPSSGTIYPMLKGMRDEGLIDGHNDNGRTYYTITAMGEEKLKELHELRSEFLRRVMNTISAADDGDDHCGDGDGAFSYIMPLVAAVRRAKSRGVDEEAIKVVVKRAVDELDGLKDGE